MGKAAYWRPYLLNRKRFSNLLRAESCQSPSESVYFLTVFHGRSRQYERCWLDAEDGERFAFDCVFPDTGLGLRTRTVVVATVCFGPPATSIYVQMSRAIYSLSRTDTIPEP